MPSDVAPNDFTVFISYARGDNENADASKRWLNRLLEHLEPLVLQDRVEAWADTEIEGGEQWDSSIRAQLLKADVAVLLVSPAFLASKYIRNSELPVLLMNAMNEGRIVIPVILRPCLFAETTFKYPDPTSGPSELSLLVFQSANKPDEPLNSMQEHEQDAVLLSVAQRILKLARSKSSQSSSADGGRTAGASSMVWNVEHPRNPFFTGRGQILEALNRELAANGKAALSGMGGVGKTQTAAEYAYRHRGEYSAVLWAKADGEDSLKAGLAALADKLGLPEKDETDRDKAVNAARRWLEANEGWLLILDNADDLALVADLLRRELRGHVLLTTRAQATGWVGKVGITEMTPEEGALFLLRRAKLIALADALGAASETDRAAATEVTNEVDGLPLALDQAGAFIEEMSSSPGEYLELYRSEGEKLRAERGALSTDHAPVTITFSLAFRQVEEASAAAADMIRACAFLAPDAIPEEIFVSGASKLGENLASASGGGVNLVKVIGEAGRFSLIRRNAKTGTIDIHRLVQQVVKDEMISDTRRLWAERAIRALNEAFPMGGHKDWPLCGKLLPHAQEAASLVEEYGFEFGEATRLLNQAGYYCNERAQYAEAEQLLGQTLSIREKTLGSDDPDVALSLNNLASLYVDQGKYAEAEPLFEQALSIYEKTLGSDNTNVARSLSNLAIVYDNQGRYTEAEPLLERALNIYEKMLGRDHTDVARCLNNLASIYWSQGKYAEAEPLFERSLSIREKAFEPDHPDIAMSLNNLASLYGQRGRYEEAESLHVRAISIRERVLGPDHPYVALSLNNLASLYLDQGKYEEAGPLYARALSIYEKVVGPDHPTSLIIRGNYEDLLGRMRARSEEKE
jgi:tetratricopeptide (TPR) repeat protein